ncbi:NAD-P-binding protein [Gymnopus androsaceus JB14]|uniref:NAD-P-binding protein n=1 Tax=Gymnopus androsaceus JB14 TaxID=1447944 RepID=A0A6A4HMG1_9AGAR|nr:NAD-P-binding protein [Gymnopus androsaceus JB14]
MRILVLGATGPVGISLCREALSSIQDSSLVLYIRSPQKLPDDLFANSRVAIVVGQLTDLDSLTKAMEGIDVVCSALGPSVKKGPFHPAGEPLAHAYEGVITAMKQAGIKRLFALGTASIPAPQDKSDIKFAALVSGVAVFARNAYKDVVKIGEIISKQDDLDWTIVRVPLLNDKGHRDVIAGFIGDGKINTALSRVGFALNEEESAWIKKAPMLCTP